MDDAQSGCSPLTISDNILDARERQVSLERETCERLSAAIAAVDCSRKQHNRIVGMWYSAARRGAAMNRTAPLGLGHICPPETTFSRNSFLLCSSEPSFAGAGMTARAPRRLGASSLEDRFRFRSSLTMFLCDRKGYS